MLWQISARPARRWCNVKDTIDSIPAEPTAEHNHAPQERRERDRDRDRGVGAARKTPPSEQTNAENFYYQKQMQSKTPMVVVLRDGEEVHGYIEWYDKHCIKLNRSGAANLMIYKPAIKYMFKEGENMKR
jgi:host factor-I protein